MTDSTISHPALTASSHVGKVNQLQSTNKTAPPFAAEPSRRHPTNTAPELKHDPEKWMAVFGKYHALVGVVADPDAMQPPAIAGMHPLDLPTIGVVRIVGVVVVIEREGREDAEAAVETITEVIAIMIMVTIDETAAVVIAIEKSAAIVTIPQPHRSRLASATCDA